MNVRAHPHLAKMALLIAIGGVVTPPLSAGIPEPTAQTADERALLAADEQQRLAVASVDIQAIEAISDPNLRVNAPTNRILTRDDLVRMVASGEIRNELFERTPEDVIVTGDVGVVMGHEVVYPGATSEQARIYGHKTLRRRYTNIYIRSDGAWRHLARHANVIPETSVR